jgi:hypothetical protein
VEGTVCEVEELPFIGRNPASMFDASEEDQELVAALHRLTEAIPGVGVF